MATFRTLFSRLRAWLRPYPDDAQMQREMLARVRFLAAQRFAYRILDAAVRHAALPNVFQGYRFTWHASRTSSPSGGNGGAGHAPNLIYPGKDSK